MTHEKSKNFEDILKFSPALRIIKTLIQSFEFQTIGLTLKILDDGPSLMEKFVNSSKFMKIFKLQNLLYYKILNSPNGY